MVLAYEDDPADDENHRRSVDNMRRLQLANGDAISRDEDDQQLQIPAGTSSTVDVGIPYEEEKPASCAVTLSIGGGGSVALSNATA